MSIFVLGSINMDLVTRTPRLPLAGETLLGYTFSTAPGGKGANQAVACARLGAATSMLGRVGADAFGQSLIDALAAQGVNTDAVVIDSTTSSGIAAIAVDDQAQNNIIVVPGANGRVGDEDIQRLAALMQAGDLLLLQLEIPLATVMTAAQLAQQKGCRVILDPAPAQDLPAELYEQVDILTPNESEAAALAGCAVDSLDDAKEAARVLLGRGVKRVIVKLAERGVVVATESVVKHYPALSVKAIDTVAAGDAFNGGLAEALARGATFEEAVTQGIQVGAYAVTLEGAQSAMPSKEELATFLRRSVQP